MRNWPEQSQIRISLKSLSSLLLVTYRWHSLVCCHTLGSSSSMKNWRLKNAGLDLTHGGFFLGGVWKRSVWTYLQGNISPLLSLPCIYSKRKQYFDVLNNVPSKCSCVPFRHPSTQQKWVLFQNIFKTIERIVANLNWSKATFSNILPFNSTFKRRKEQWVFFFWWKYYTFDYTSI